MKSRVYKMEAKIASRVGKAVRGDESLVRKFPSQSVDQLIKLLEDLLSEHRTMDMPRDLSTEFNHRLDGRVSPEGLLVIMEEYAQTPYFLNKFVAHNLMKLLAYFDQFELTKKVYDYLSHWKVTDTFTYSIMIDASGKNGLLALAANIFAQAERARACNEHVYAAIIDAAGRNGDLVLAKSAFGKALLRKNANEIVFVNMVNAAVENYSSDDAIRFFDLAASQNKLTSHAGTSMIKAAGQAGDLAMAIKVFEKAKLIGFCNAYIYTSMVDAAGRNNNFSLAQDIFKQAVDSRNATVATYAAMIKAAGCAREIELVEYFFQEALSKVSCNAYIFNSVIDAATIVISERSMEIAWNAFNEASQRGQCNEHVYASMIEVAGKNDNLTLAAQLFDVALEVNLCNEYACVNMIHAAGKNGDFSLAEYVFSRAQAANLANAVSYATLIAAAGACDNPEAVEHVFQFSKQSGKINPRIYTTVVTSLLQCKADNSARISEIFDEAFSRGQWDDDSFQFLQGARASLGESNFSSDTIVTKAYPSASLSDKHLISRGAFGQVFSARWNKNIDQTESSFVAVKEIHVQGSLTIISQCAALPTLSNSRSWFEIYHRYASEELHGKIRYLCLYDRNQRNWHLCSIDTVFFEGGHREITCRTVTLLRVEFDNFLRKEALGNRGDNDLLLSAYGLSFSGCQHCLDTEFSTVNQNSHSKTQLLKLCDLVLMERKQQEWRALREEVMLLMRLDHPHVVKLYGITLSQEPYEMIMDLYAGGDLATRLYSGLTIEKQQKLQWALQMTLGLAYLHEKNIIHGDLKPANMLLTTENRLVLADFGLSSLGEKRSKRGTASYMAPELLQETSEVFVGNTKASDIYSLGVVLWELEANSRPWAGIDKGKFIYHVTHGETLLLRDSWLEQYKNLLLLMWTMDAVSRPEASECAAVLEDISSNSLLTVASSAMFVQQPSAFSAEESSELDISFGALEARFK